MYVSFQNEKIFKINVKNNTKRHDLCFSKQSHTAVYLLNLE